MGQGKAKDSITNVPSVRGTATVGWLLRAPLPLPKFTMERKYDSTFQAMQGRSLFEAVDPRFQTVVSDVCGTTIWPGAVVAFSRLSSRK